MFAHSDHEEIYNRLLSLDGTSPNDRERQAFFYIMAGCLELRGRVNCFYNFGERVIQPESLNAIDLSRGIHSLVELAFNLYNNYPCGTVVDLFANMDVSNKRLAIEAIKMRIGIW